MNDSVTFLISMVPANTAAQVTETQREEDVSGSCSLFTGVAKHTQSQQVPPRSQHRDLLGRQSWWDRADRSVPGGQLAPPRLEGGGHTQNAGAPHVLRPVEPPL